MDDNTNITPETPLNATPPPNSESSPIPFVEAPPTPPSAPENNLPNLNNVESGYWAYMKKRWWLIAIIFVVCAVIARFFFFYGVILFAAGILALRYKYEDNLFQAFAVANNFDFYKKGDAGYQPGIIFSIGHSQKFRDIVVGTYRNWQFEMFLYIYSIGYGRNETTYHRPVLSVNFATQLPAFILRKHKSILTRNAEGESLATYGYTTELNLEGDFNDHFEVHVRPDTQVDVLTILTPDVMEIIQNLDKYEVEMTDAGIFYIYAHDYITKKQDLIDIYSILEAVTSKIGRFAAQEQQIKTFEQTAINPVAPAV